MPRTPWRWLGLLCLTLASRAEAVPSFARATGFACEQCHTQFPELTSFGRAFKVTGYTMVTKATVSSDSSTGSREILDFLAGVPLSAMIQASLTLTQEALPTASGGHAQNASVVFPERLSLFYAGLIAPQLGAFTQLSYDGVSNRFGIEAADIRFAQTTTLFGTDLIFGFTLNNNPTITDLWNGTPAWSFPFASSAVAPRLTATPLIAGPLAQNVVGLTAYALWHQLIYAEAGAYRSFPLGTAQPLGIGPDAANVIQAVAPYWRVALQKDFEKNAFEVGTFGLQASLFPGGNAPLAAPTDQYLDLGFDAQYQYVGADHIFSANATYIHESQSLAAANGGANTSGELNRLTLSGGYLYDRWIGGRVGAFSTFGAPDLYQPAAAAGGFGGSPDGTGAIAELDFIPWLNTKLSFQYVGYLNVNGSFGSFGSRPVDNSTYYLLLWLAF